MGLFDKLRGELIDIIEWLDDSRDTIVYRFERYNNEIKNGAKLTVRESQVAVFIEKGQIADVFEPGMYELTTENLPILSTIHGWKHGFNSPFKAEVYFINTRRFPDQKWGTKNPIMMRDPEFGMVRLRAFGSYSLRITDAPTFLKEVVGTDQTFTADEINEQLRNIVVARFTDALGECKVPVLDLAANYNELADFLMKNISGEFSEYGIELVKLLVENISLPPQVEQALDKRTSMGIAGNLNQYTQFQAANAMEAAANNPSGGASEGMGMGMGMAMAQQFMNSNQNNQSNTQNSGGGAAPPPLPGNTQYHVARDGQQTGPFTVPVLKQMAESGQLTPDQLVWTKGMAAWTKASEVDEIKPLFSQAPPPIPGA